jgi:hypothetical protein
MHYLISRPDKKQQARIFLIVGIALVLIAAIIGYRYLDSYLNRPEIAATTEVRDTNQQKGYKFYVTKDKWWSPDAVFLGKNQELSIDCAEQPCQVKTDLGETEASYYQNRFYARISGKDISNYSSISIRLSPNATASSQPVYLFVKNLSSSPTDESSGSLFSCLVIMGVIISFILGWWIWDEKWDEWSKYLKKKLWT